VQAQVPLSHDHGKAIVQDKNSLSDFPALRAAIEGESSRQSGHTGEADSTASFARTPAINRWD